MWQQMNMMRFEAMQQVVKNKHLVRKDRLKNTLDDAAYAWF